MQTLQNIKRKAAAYLPATASLPAAAYLRQGITPRRLALTLVLGFVVGCIPVIGLPTALCAVIALAFRLNQPAIQAANYMAMPFQVGLVVPLERLGGKFFPMAAPHGMDVVALRHSPMMLLAHSPQMAVQIGGMAGQALFAWLLLAVPVVLLVTPALTLVLRRVPAVAGHPSDGDLSLGTPTAAAESGD
jgi:hypothetical protein